MKSKPRKSRRQESHSDAGNRILVTLQTPGPGDKLRQDPRMVPFSENPAALIRAIRRLVPNRELVNVVGLAYWNDGKTMLMLHWEELEGESLSATVEIPQPYRRRFLSYVLSLDERPHVLITARIVPNDGDGGEELPVPTLGAAAFDALTSDTAVIQ